MSVCKVGEKQMLRLENETESIRNVYREEEKCCPICKGVNEVNDAGYMLGCIECETCEGKGKIKEEEKVGMIYKDTMGEWTFSHKGYIELTLSELLWITEEFYKIKYYEDGKKVIWTEGP